MPQGLANAVEEKAVVMLDITRWIDAHLPAA
jgi:hypothetical protein